MSCPDLLGRKLRCVILRSATLREENRVSLGLPGQVQHTPGLESAICNLRSAILREENRVSLGLPGQVQHMPGLESAICNLRCAACDLQVPRHGHVHRPVQGRAVGPQVGAAAAERAQDARGRAGEAARGARASAAVQP